MTTAGAGKRSAWSAVGRAVRGRCPACGRGRLLQGYLTLVPACPGCGEPLGRIRADDGPAWLTILVTGHVLIPVVLSVERQSPWPEWVSMTLWPALALAMVLLLLPRAKGVFVGFLWATRAPGSEDGAAPLPAAADAVDVMKPE